MNEIIEQFKTQLARTGRSEQECAVLMQNLTNFGFFKAPASTMFHLCQPGGLARHSLNVAACAERLRAVFIEMKPEVEARLPLGDVIFAALFHDVCKSEIYREVQKWRKDANNQWESYTTYEVDNTFQPFGHGEKSVIRILQWQFSLTDDQIAAIRWHMGAWEIPLNSNDAKGNFHAAQQKYPMVALLMLADQMASAIVETEESK